MLPKHKFNNGLPQRLLLAGLLVALPMLVACSGGGDDKKTVIMELELKAVLGVVSKASINNLSESSEITGKIKAFSTDAKNDPSNEAMSAAHSAAANDAEFSYISYGQNPASPNQAFITGSALLPINAHYAYAQGFDGTGVVIGVMDRGFYADHVKFNQQLVSGIKENNKYQLEQIAGCVAPESEACTSSNHRTIIMDVADKAIDEIDHGTGVASMVAGAKTGTIDGRMHGVAYGSKLTLRALNLDESQISGSKVSDQYNAAFALYIADMLKDGMEVLSLSIGRGPTHLGTEYALDVKEVITSGQSAADRHFRVRAEAIYGGETQSGNALLIVAAAGNDYRHRPQLTSNPDYANHPAHDAALGVLYPELRDRFITAVAVNTRPLTRLLLDNDAATIDGKTEETVYNYAQDMEATAQDLENFKTLLVRLNARIKQSNYLEKIEEALSGGFYQPEIASFSNHCGIAGPWCIAAPGTSLLVAGVGNDPNGMLAGEYGVISGTSFAAPLVSGALAILIDQFRLSDTNINYTNIQIMERLLQTANRQGIYAPNAIYDAANPWTLKVNSTTETFCDYDDDTADKPPCLFNAIYGAGLLDLDAATRPWGTPVSMYHPQGEGHTSGATRALLGKTHIEVSPAFGDALSLALEDKTAYFFDALEFAFPMPATALAPVPHSNMLANRLAGFERIERHVAGNFHGMGFATGEANSKAGLYLMPVNMAEGREGFTGLDSYLSLAQEGQGFAAGWKRERHSLGFALLTSEEGRDESGSRVMVLAYGYETPKGVGVSLRAGWAEEESALLGAETSGLYGQSEAGRTFFASFGASLSLAKGWHGFADIEAGRTEASQAASGAFETSALVSTSMAAGVWRKNMVAEGDWLGFMVSQPLRIEDGHARFSYASGRKSNAVVVMTHEEFSLTPSGRTLEFQTAYRAPESRSGFTWQAAAGISLAPRHRANANPETWGLVSVTHRF